MMRKSVMKQIADPCEHSILNTNIPDIFGQSGSVCLPDEARCSQTEVRYSTDNINDNTKQQG